MCTLRAGCGLAALAAKSLPRQMGIVSAVVMVVSIIVGFTLIDSPALARARAIDNQRAFHVQHLQSAVRGYYRKYEKLPESLAVLREVLPDREVVAIPCANLVVGLGAIHCLTQQEPA